MTRPDLQHPDAQPQPHYQPACAREGCDRRAIIATNMTPLCAEHWAELCKGPWST
jgi:hypothetical protein